MYWTSDRGVVTIVPGRNWETTREIRPFFVIDVEGSAMNDMPPFDIAAPRTKSTWPPVPLYIEWPRDSDAHWPVRSTVIVLLIETMWSFLAMLLTLLV